MKPPNGKDGNVIKGPWPNSSVKISDVDGVAAVEELNWAENLTEGIMVQMIQTLNENNFETTSPQFLTDIAFAIEVIKSIIYRNMGHAHPLQDVIERLVNLIELRDGEKVKFASELNFEAIKDVSDFLSIDDDDPNLA